MSTLAERRPAIELRIAELRAILADGLCLDASDHAKLERAQRQHATHRPGSFNASQTANVIRQLSDPAAVTARRRKLQAELDHLVLELDGRAPVLYARDLP